MLLLALWGCAATQPAPPAGPEDLLGRWVGPDGSEEWVRLGEALVGVGFAVQDGKTVFFEALCLHEREGSTVYTAIPGGEHLADFPQVGEGLRFENPAHDFPTAIAYSRRGQRLEAEVSGPGQPTQRIALQAAPPAPAPALEEADRAFDAAVAAGGAAAWAAAFDAEGAQWTSHGPVKGPEAIEDLMEPVFAAYSLRWAPTASGLSPAGDWGFTVGEAEIQQGGAPVDTSRYLTIWRQQADGAWKVALDVEVPFR